MVLACDSWSFSLEGEEGGSRAGDELLKTRTRGGRRKNEYKNEESEGAV